MKIDSSIVFVSKTRVYTRYENGNSTLKFFDLYAWGDPDTGWWVVNARDIVGEIDSSYKVNQSARYPSEGMAVALRVMAAMLKRYTVGDWE